MRDLQATAAVLDGLPAVEVERTFAEVNCGPLPLLDCINDLNSSTQSEVRVPCCVFPCPVCFMYGADECCSRTKLITEEDGNVDR